MRSPVLFLVFNRPNSTRQVFDAIRSARPSKLYIAADGPRANRPLEANLCDEVRDIALSVDWPCQVNTLFREDNLGCKRGVSEAITWFFDREDEGIILEDDVLPVPTFFRFCDDMLERFRSDTRVSMISGCNLISRHYARKQSYFFFPIQSYMGVGDLAPRLAALRCCHDAVARLARPARVGRDLRRKAFVKTPLAPYFRRGIPRWN